MINKISFSSHYLVNNSKGEIKSHNTSRIIQSSLPYLRKDNEISVSRTENGYLLNVPDYIDEDVEKYCLYSGIKYKKY